MPAQKAKGILRDHPGFVRGDISHKTGSLKRVSRVTPESLPALSSGTPDSQIPLRPQSTVRRQMPQRYSPIYSTKNCIALPFMFKSSLSLEFILYMA